MVKEKNYNPAQEFHKKRKREYIKKAKAEKQKLRDEKLARRDPNKIEAQIHEFKRLEEKGQLSALDRSNLSILESDLKKVLKARKHIGPIIESEKTKARDAKEEKRLQKIPKNPKKSIYYDPIYNPYGVPPPGMPYKEWSDTEDDKPSTPESIAAIPMPEGSPPPSSCLLYKKEKKLYQKRFKHLNKTLQENVSISQTPLHSENRNKDENNGFVEEIPPLTSTPIIVYSADSILRDLKKESTAFIPTAVRRKTISSQRVSNPPKDHNTMNSILKRKSLYNINAAPDISDDI
ncbi:hypothetical protein PCANB_001804 [Pneumocystis canis]|nr:hypothetical protein PCK1_002199 [Pneumocystis canis]KAG5440234.1 hypothetical protein PCANB_001804 [Pneumocystis canis]